MKIKCRLCGRNVHEIRGYLARVNEKGVPAIWECRPSCDSALNYEEALLQAIEAAGDKEIIIRGDLE